MKENYSLLNSRMKRELRRIGCVQSEGRFLDKMKLDDVTSRLLYLLTDHGDRVYRRSPAGRLKAMKAMKS